MIALVSTITILLENLLSNYLNGTNLSILFSVCLLAIVYPYFFKEEKKYFIFASLLGLVYDLLFFNFMFYNLIIFLVLAILVNRISLILINNFINTILLVLIIIFIYLSIIYILYTWQLGIPFLITNLIQSFYKNIVANIIFTTFMYFLIDTLSVKFGVQKNK